MADDEAEEEESERRTGTATAVRIFTLAGRTDGLQVYRRYKKKAEDQSEANVQTNTTAGACCGDFRNELQ
jgi:hypothetical protein